MRGLRKGYKRQEDGAVLLTTLLVMSLMAALAVAVIEDVRTAVKRSINIQSYAQADWYMRGAEAFGQNYLSNLAASASPEQIGQALLEAEPILFPIEGGAIAILPRDGSQCFSLDALQTSDGTLMFRKLLESLGYDIGLASQLTNIAVDWQDVDTQINAGGAEDYTYLGRSPAYRTANTPFASVTEIRALETMTEEQYQALRPFLCARPGSENMAININTLSLPQAPLLAAALGGPDALPLAVQLITERPVEGYRDRAGIESLPVMADYDANEAQWDYIVFAPRFIWIEAHVSYFEAERTGAFEYAFTDGKINLIFRRRDAEAFRPQLEQILDDTLDDTLQ